MNNAIQTQIANVTTACLVTAVMVVTPETLAAQYLSPLSLLSLLFILAIHARDKGLGMTEVTSDAVTLVTVGSAGFRFCFDQFGQAKGVGASKVRGLGAGTAWVENFTRVQN